MKYYSTNGNAPVADLRKAVVKGLAEDRGLYMPERIKTLPKEFFDNMKDMSFQEIAYTVADAFFGEDVEANVLRQIVYDTLAFDCPVVKVEENIYALELFHGPTLAFKDVGARFMARMLASQNPSEGGEMVNVLVATSGDTGSAVANGFLGVEGIHVYVLYPKGKVSHIQESQFTTLGRNITAIEVDGVFDDCQRLVKSAFMDEELNRHMRLTSANSINVARFLPQAFYYFNAVARLIENGEFGIENYDYTEGSKKGMQANLNSPFSIPNSQLVMCVPSGNFGNICSALFGHEMGLPVSRFIAANNANDVFYQYLQTGQYNPKASVQTLANAMDVGDPSNFARIINLYSRNGQLTPEETHRRISSLISGCTYTDEQIRETMRQCYDDTGYVLDPHGACGYRALKEQLREGEVGVFCETAHPAKFKEKVDEILGTDIAIPERLQAFMRGQKQSVTMGKEFQVFKEFLLS
jgi:threonine synthase